MPDLPPSLVHRRLTLPADLDDLGELKLSKNELAYQKALDLLERYNFCTTSEDDTLHFYRDGVWIPEGEHVTRRDTDRDLGDQASTTIKNEVIRHIKDNSTALKYTDFNQDKNLISVSNTVISVEHNPLKSLGHEPEQYLTYKIPHKYDPDAECPKIDAFLDQVAPGQKKNLLEMTGYCLYPSYPIQRWFILLGGGANGKTTFLRLLTQFLGPENVTSQRMSDLSSNRFRIAKLRGKLANICPDTPTKGALRETGMVKALTGGDIIPAEKKNRDPFEFVNFAKLIFAANALPEVNDASDAFWRRPLLIDFPNQFKKEDPNTRNQDEILAELTTPEEMSGFLNLALESLQRLLKRGAFEESRSQEELQVDWERKSDPIRSFINEMCVVDREAEVEKQELYSAYVDYCTKLPAIAEKEKSFVQNLKRHVPLRDRRSSGPGRPMIWIGIALGGGIYGESSGESLGDEEEASSDDSLYEPLDGWGE